MKKQGRRSQGSRGRRAQELLSHPPQIPDFTVRHGTRLRFVANAAVGQVVTYQNLLDLFLVATTAVAGFDLFATVKIRAVEVWADAVVGNAATVSVSFDGGTAGSVGDQRWHTDTSMGIQPAHVKARPSAKALCSNYQLSSNAAAFYLACPTGAVVDVELSYVQILGSAVAAQNALVGATPGAFYTRGLDGLAVATTKLTPVGLSSI